MKIQKELVKISKDLEKISRRIQKLSSSIPKEKGMAPKTSMPKPAASNKGKKSGIQAVLDIIQKSKTGIDAGSLIKRPGLKIKRSVTSSSKPRRLVK
jgi:hypothetical protein